MRMIREISRATGLACALILVVTAAAGIAGAQVMGLYYQEVQRDGRYYVFNTPERFKAFTANGDIGAAITLPDRGPKGETVVAENETALDLFLFKHNLPAYDRPTRKPAPAASVSRTTISGRIFADATSKTLKDEGTGVESSDSGVGTDVKRFFFTVTHDFNDTWGAKFQSDIGDAGATRYDVYVKNAYLQGKLSEAAIFRLGAAPTPWVPFIEGLQGQRYLERMFLENLSFGTTAEWGLHFLGKAASNMVGYALTIGNGKGYASPTRSKSVDFEGRVSIEPVAGLTLGLGGYSGKRGSDTAAVPAKHTATRFDATANWVIGQVKVGGEYFSAKDWNRVTQATEDTSNGYSGWLQYAVGPQWTVFGRYDTANPSQTLVPALKLSYYNLGVQWKPIKPLTAAVAYKYAECANGTITTGNGTIGSTRPGSKGTYDEVGFWFSFDF